MGKLDETEDNVYEVDTSFTTAKRKSSLRPVDINEEEVKLIIMTYHYNSPY